MPTVFSIDPPGQRARRPGGPLTTGAAGPRPGPSRSVRPRNWSVNPLLHADRPASWRTACGPHHQPGEVELPLVRRHVGALHVAELALVALVDHLVLLGGGQRRRVPVVGVDEVEQRRERRAQVEAQPAAVAQVEDRGRSRPGGRPGRSTFGIGRVVGGGHARAARCLSDDGLEPLREAAGMALLGPGQRLEPLGDLLEALVAGGLGEARGTSRCTRRSRPRRPT